ncbi:unnamed protein product [Moneuplotes crassus]|uniref:Uncharacterized protein n=2 Tax=Euplotes crassus TaxID=5936 RepID=A0AAD1Y058_EUPCR|nr:unnamed protein product [Moneuplotes crassus]
MKSKLRSKYEYFEPISAREFKNPKSGKKQSTSKTRLPKFQTLKSSTKKSKSRSNRSASKNKFIETELVIKNEYYMFDPLQSSLALESSNSNKLDSTLGSMSLSLENSSAPKQRTSIQQAERKSKLESQNKKNQKNMKPKSKRIPLQQREAIMSISSHKLNKQRSPEGRIDKISMLLDDTARKAKRQSGRFPRQKTMGVKKYMTKHSTKAVVKGAKEKPTNFVPKITNIDMAAYQPKRSLHNKTLDNSHDNEMMSSPRERVHRDFEDEVFEKRHFSKQSMDCDIVTGASCSLPLEDDTFRSLLKTKDNLKSKYGKRITKKLTNLNSTTKENLSSFGDACSPRKTLGMVADFKESGDLDHYEIDEEICTTDFETAGYKEREGQITPKELLMKKTSSDGFISRRMSSHSIDERDLRKGSVCKIMMEEETKGNGNTPYLPQSLNWMDEMLIKPLKNEKMRDTLMPSYCQQNSRSGDLAVPTLKQSSVHNSPSITKKNLKKFFDIPNPVNQTMEERKICDLQVQVSGLKKENMELRMIINKLLEMGMN